MTENTEFPTGVYLSSLDTGSAVDLETKSRHYRIEYLEGDRIRISGHPRWCPTPVVARLHGSTVGLGGVAEGYIPCKARRWCTKAETASTVEPARKSVRL